MSIAVKVPVLPFSASYARVGHWYKALNEVVGRGETLVELLVRDEVLSITAPQAGLIKQIFFSEGETVAVAAVLAELETGLPNLVWDPEKKTLILETYRASGVTTSMEYELRQHIRQGEAKFGQGIGSGLALPQSKSPESEHGLGTEMETQPQLKSQPLIAPSSQFAGNFRNPSVIAVPSEAKYAPQYAHTLAARPQAGAAPSPKPK